MTIDTNEGRVSVEQIADWLYCLSTPVVNAYAVRQSDGFVLIDSGVAGHEQEYLDALAEIAGRNDAEVRLLEILLTHGHDDHTGSAAALARITGARVLGPALDAEAIAGRAPQGEPDLLDWERPLYSAFGKVAPAPPVELDVLIDGETQLGWERRTQIVAAPGHTAGSVAIFFPDERVLVAGDAIASIAGEPHLGVFNVDTERAKATYRLLARLDVEVLCVGHGHAITGDAVRGIAAVQDLGAPPQHRHG